MSKAATLSLLEINRKVDGESYLDNINLTLDSTTINVLLGPTRSGKTSLLRVMAGLDRPDSGKLLFNGEDVSRWPVKKRNVAMVYQQFINYPSLSVFENIASPLRVVGKPQKEILSSVARVAELLQIEPFLNRMPEELSGGQQQRLALARALVKKASLVLLDEPLANLDYKLRESLREDLPRLFAKDGSIVVYATTEPAEALLLGGRCATLSEGRVTQFGPVFECFSNPANRITAATYSDPPMNMLDASVRGQRIHIDNGIEMAMNANAASVPDGDYLLGFRPMNLSIVSDSSKDLRLDTHCKFAEITGSESLIHVQFQGQTWVSQNRGIHSPETGAPLALFLNPAKVFLFDGNGKTMMVPHGEH